MIKEDEEEDYMKNNAAMNMSNQILLKRRLMNNLTI